MTHINLRRVEDVYPLPPGTFISNTWIVTDEGVISTLSGDAYNAQSVVGYEVDVADNPPPRRRETYDEFRQRLCVMARGFQRDHGVSAEPVYDLLRRFDCWFEGEAAPGQWVYRSDEQMTPPSDRVLTVGASRNWAHYGVFTPHWSPLFGGLRSTRFARVDGPYPTPTDEDAERIRALKVEVWEAGVRAKSNQSWCGAFERMVGAMRIDANVRRVQVTAPVGATGTVQAPLQFGAATTVYERAASPIGSIFEWRNTTGASWNWTVRRDSHNASQNRAGTDHLLGPNTGHYSTGSADTVVHDGSQPMWIPVTDGERGRALMEALPIGTHLATTTDRGLALSGTGHVYKHANGWHAYPDGVSDGAALSTENLFRHEGWTLHIMQMPGVPGAEPSQGPGAVDLSF